jgi:hypothetical protein
MEGTQDQTLLWRGKVQVQGMVTRELMLLGKCELALDGEVGSLVHRVWEY